jgi:hypothetical protein
MSLDVSAVTLAMLAAAKGVVGETWPATQTYFESEAKIFAERFTSIANLRAEGLITESRARRHVELQKEAWETVLLAVAGLNQIMVEEALNAALDAVTDVVNAAMGFALL